MTEKEKPIVKKWIGALDSRANKGERRALCKKIIAYAKRPTRRRVEVNLYDLDMYTKPDENVIVPGKILSTGKISHKVNISAMEFSQKALDSLKQSKCNIVDIEEMLSKKNVRIII